MTGAYLSSWLPLGQILHESSMIICNLQRTAYHLTRQFVQLLCSSFGRLEGPCSFSSSDSSIVYGRRGESSGTVDRTATCGMFGKVGVCRRSCFMVLSLSMSLPFSCRKICSRTRHAWFHDSDGFRSPPRERQPIQSDRTKRDCVSFPVGVPRPGCEQHSLKAT